MDLSVLPTELLQQLFTCLPGRSLFRFRQVCSRWKDIIDDLTKTDALWHVLCERDYRLIYREARKKANPNISRCTLYKSLTLWSKLDYALEEWHVFAYSAYENIKISHVLNGTVAIHKENSIVYCDLKTLAADKATLYGEYKKYQETDKHIVLLDVSEEDSSTLNIITKNMEIPVFEDTVHIERVNDFLLVEKALYYVQFKRAIFVCNLEDMFQQTYMNSVDTDVMALSYSNGRLNILTKECTIYTLIGADLYASHTFTQNSYLPDVLRQYNFQEQFDKRLWRLFQLWNKPLIDIPKRRRKKRSPGDIMAMRTYDNVVIVGTVNGILRIYYAPYASGELDLVNIEPVKEYDLKIILHTYQGYFEGNRQFYARPRRPSSVTICGIDIVEMENGHMVLVSTTYKVVLIKYLHFFKRTALMAMLSNGDEVDEKKLLIRPSITFG